MIDKTALLLQAQFYMRELEERANSWVSIRDLVLEIVIIVLIGWEIYLGYQQGHQFSDAFTKVQSTLSGLQTSSAATANTLTALQSTTETMSGAIQKELELFYDVYVGIVYDNQSEKLTLVNLGRTNAQIWGNKFWNETSVLDKEGRTISPNGTFTIDASGIVQVISSKIPVGVNQFIPCDLFLKSEDGTKYTEHFYFATNWKDGKLFLTTQIVYIRRQNWPSQ